MQKIFGFVSAVALALVLTGPAHATATDREVLIAVAGAFVPDGLTVNDEAFVVGSGMFPNSCYKWSRATVQSVTPFDHRIRSYGWVDQTGPCLMYLVPFSEKVSMGRLPAGIHRVRFLSHDDTFLEKQFEVR